MSESEYVNYEPREYRTRKTTEFLRELRLESIRDVRKIIVRLHIMERRHGN